ncbi:hypothetical protein D3Z36_06105 [Lachnospiraceae bacterium]|nr:hypothetical protein [Lachnospiraceae bacterium]
MRKNEMKKKWNETDIRNYLEESAKDQEIPKSLLPAQMEEWLRQQTAEGIKKEKETDEEAGGADQRGLKKSKYFGWWCGSFAAAACLALVLFAVGKNMDWKLEVAGDKTADMAEMNDSAADTTEVAAEGTTYEKLYQAFDKTWKQQENLYLEKREYAEDDAVADDAATEDTGTAEGAMITESAEDTADSANMDADSEHETEDYGKTNQQEEEVEEADIIKNDGRYLYQAVLQRKDEKYTVRIADTKGGLTETARVGSFQMIQDIYVWKDKLVVLEPGWAESSQETDSMQQSEYIYEDQRDSGFIQILKDGLQKIFQHTSAADAKVSDIVSGYAYCRIHIYDIAKRSDPREYHTFTIKGGYMDSRISDGYLYFFSSCETSRPADAENLKTYVPMLDGKPMAEDKITLPENTDAASYLVMASVDMEQPDKFVDTKALVTSADKFYVSRDNIYVADIQYPSYSEKGRQTDSTRLFRFSYKDGRMEKAAEGSVKGTLRDDMAMNEYQDYLRLVTTVENSNIEEIVDDISGEVLGYDSLESETTNSLYVLDANLQVTGKIENLAKDERIYSARFMGDSGYFVTFRETDPLFSVDLSNPREPKILGELKISGFSEYLHFYSDNLLLGIGMEADEETGETQGVKLSMFDISNPADVKEQSKIHLSEYDYADALYNYKAVLIDPKKNLFGFSAEGYGEEDKRDYLLFSYENGEFQQILKIDCSDSERWSWTIRGTYIKDRFFLLGEDGRIEEYSLTDKSRTRELEP